MRIPVVAFVASLVLAVAPASAADKTPRKPKPRPMTEAQRAVHALNRLTFGARPGDLRKVRAMGVDKWIEQQLNPDQIDDKAVDPRVAPLLSVRMATAQLLQNFPPPPVVQAVDSGRLPMPTQPSQKVVYEVQVAALHERQQVQKENQEKMKMGADVAPPTPSGPTPEQQESARKVADSLITLPRGQRVARLAELPVNDLVSLRFLRPEVRDRLNAALTPEEREVIFAMANPQAVVTGELMQHKLLRAIYSTRQLQEVMTDFWFNHFNVFIYKDSDQYLTTGYERDVIRPHALGKFKDLLAATAASPAMLVYLDNAQSVGPNSAAAQQAAKRTVRPGQPAPVVPGLNENYGRELMELHTLGVNGGYTQQDVIEVARVFTGWGVSPPQFGAQFTFEPRRHEPGDKTVLAHVIHEAGQKEGVEVLNLLAASPATAHFISTKLAKRFVADDPPPALVDRMAQTFLASDGDIKEVLRTLFRSKEFWNTGVYRAKVKTPLEFVVSAVRATGTDVQNAQMLIGALGRMGMPLYQQQPPTGYSSANDAWLNSDALLERMNFALQFVNSRQPGLTFDSSRTFTLQVLNAGIPPAPKHAAATHDAASDLVLRTLESELLSGDVSPQTDKSIRAQLADPKVVGDALQDPTRMLNVMTALVVGSPEFQKR